MPGLSSKELELVSELEFSQKYFFRREELQHFFKSRRLLTRHIHNLMKKGRVVKLNRNKYFLIPIKAKGGFWAEHPVILADEACDSQGYFIGGAYAKYYWKFIEQVPTQVDIYTTRRQGQLKVMGVALVFHRTTENRVRRAVKESASGHGFYIASREMTRKWLKK